MSQQLALRPAGRTQLPATVGPGERLYREFLAGRSPNTLNAYRQDLAAFAAFQGARGQERRWSALIALSGRRGQQLAPGVARSHAGGRTGASHHQPPAVGRALGSSLRSHDWSHNLGARD